MHDLLVATLAMREAQQTVLERLADLGFNYKDIPRAEPNIKCVPHVNVALKTIWNSCLLLNLSISIDTLERNEQELG